MPLHDSVERHEVADVACAVIVRRCRKLHENRQAEGRDFVPKRRERLVIEIAVIAVAGKIVRVVQAPKAKNLVRTIDLGEYFVTIRDRLVDVQQACELLRVLVLRERIVVVHHTVAAARLQNAMIDPRIDHLRHHKGGRCLNSLHTYRHILDRVALALMGKLESAIETDPKADVIKAGPGIVLRSEKHRRFQFLAVANAKRLGRRTRHVLLDVFEVNIDGRVPTGAMPILEDVSVAVDDHCRHTNDELDARERQFATERPADQTPSRPRRTSHYPSLIRIMLCSCPITRWGAAAPNAPGSRQSLDSRNRSPAQLGTDCHHKASPDYQRGAGRSPKES